MDTNNFRMYVRGGIALLSVMSLVVLTAVAIIDPKTGGAAIIAIAANSTGFYFAAKKEEL